MIVEVALSFASWLGTRIADKGFDTIVEKLKNEDVIDRVFKDRINEASKKIEDKYPDILGNSISYFFTKEEVFEELCKLLFVNQKVNITVISKSFDTDTLPANFILDFISELRKELSKEPLLQKFLANKEIYLAINEISGNMRELSKSSELSYKELREIKEILSERIRLQKKFNLNDFLSLYKKNLITNLGTVNFIGLGVEPSIKKGKKKELESLFVKPTFKINNATHTAKSESDNSLEQVLPSDLCELHYSELFAKNDNYVILGNPGAGKSLLVKSIICNLAKSQSDQFKRKELISYIPFRIELKNYHTYKKTNSGSIIKYLTYLLENEYSIPSITEDDISSVLKNEKVIIFFDGLDEIFNVTDKNKIKNDIENFHNQFSNIKSITTSRFIGYNDVKLDEKRFSELSICPFNRDQIREYVIKWYTLEEDDEETRNTEIEDFTSKMNNIDNELLSNPLLLSLIVILYRNNLKIPESKLDIYKSCTNTLVDKWDASKDLKIEISEAVKQRKEAILSDLAYWQYELESSKKSEMITYSNAKRTVAESLEKKKIADEFNSDKLAEAFLDFAQKRSIYFDNNFTHKTFLEYYTAYWIYTNIEKKHKTEVRNKLIVKNITNPFWYIVLELLLNMIDENQPDSEIIDEIMLEHIKEPKTFPFLIYILPNIKNVSEKVSLDIYNKAISYLISDEDSGNISKVKKDIYQKIVQNTHNNQRQIIYKAFQSFEIAKRSALFYILYFETKVGKRSNKNEFNALIKEDKNYYELLNKDPYLFKFHINYTDNDVIISLEKYIHLFGYDPLFRNFKTVFASYTLSSYIFNFINYYLSTDSIKNLLPDLNRVNDNEVLKVQMISYLIKSSLYFFIKLKEIDFQYILMQLDENTNEKSKLLIFLLIIRLLSPFGMTLNRNLLINYSKNQSGISFKTRSVIQLLLNERKLKLKKIELINQFVEIMEINDKEIIDIIQKYERRKNKIMQK